MNPLPSPSPTERTPRPKYFDPQRSRKPVLPFSSSRFHPIFFLYTGVTKLGRSGYVPPTWWCSLSLLFLIFRRTVPYVRFTVRVRYTSINALSLPYHIFTLHCTVPYVRFTVRVRFTSTRGGDLSLFLLLIKHGSYMGYTRFPRPPFPQETLKECPITQGPRG